MSGLCFVPLKHSPLGVTDFDLSFAVDPLPPLTGRDILLFFFPNCDFFPPDTSLNAL